MPKGEKKNSPANRGAAAGKRSKLTSFVAAGTKYRFPKGVSGNPSGRSKDDAARIEARALLNSRIPNDPEGRIFARGICHQLGWMALSGDKAAAEILFDRAFGRPKITAKFSQNDPLLDLIDSMKAESKRIGPPPMDDEETIQ